MIIPSIAVDAIKLRNYLKNNTIEPLKIYESQKFNESNRLFVYTFQCGFKTEKELEMFKKLAKIINAGILDVNEN